MKALDSRNRAERRAVVLRRTRVGATAVAALTLLSSPIVLLSAPDDFARELIHIAFTFSVDETCASRVVAVDARKPIRAHEILNVDLPIARDVVAEMERAGVAQVPGDSRLLDERIGPFLQRFGVERCLLVPLRWSERIFGYLSLDQERNASPFTAEQKRAAESLAHQAAIAVHNARLVHDLRVANRAKTDFLSMMSHELRTPLHVITGFTEILEDSLGSARSQTATDALARIRRASANLLDLVNTTLDLTRLDSGRDEPVLEDLSLRVLLLEARQDLEPLAMTKAPYVTLEWLPAESAILRTDARKLRIILRNLVGNALKFTHEGRVVVGFQVVDGRLRITVRDTGVGIPADQIPFLFDMFQQGHSGDNRPYGGVGLGLYIVRRLAEQLGGEVHVESEPGHGSTFTVTVPIAARTLPRRGSNDRAPSPALGI